MEKKGEEKNKRKKKLKDGMASTKSSKSPSMFIEV